LATSDIVDLDADLKEARRRLRERLRQIILPIAAVILIIAAITGISLYSYESNRRDALALAGLVLTSLEERVRTETRSFLGEAARQVELLRQVLAQGGGGPDRERLEALAMPVLTTTPQLTLIGWADRAGNYVMLKRNAAGGLDSKEIRVGDGGPRRVVWWRRDQLGRVVAEEADPADVFDPRSRPWFQAALAAPAIAFTDVYVFFTDRRPGITASTAIADAGGIVTGVVAGDIALADLSAFLNGLQVSANGRAMIIDAAGRLVAFADAERMLRAEGDRLRTARLDELGDPLLAQVYDRIRIAGAGRHVLDLDGTSYIVMLTPLRDVVGRDWSLLALAPESDFVGFVAENNRRALAMSAAVVALAAGLAVLLALQGFRADRARREADARAQAFAQQSQAFATLASSAAVFLADEREGLAQLTSAVANALVARRVSVWRLDRRAEVLVCEDCVDREAHGHTAGMELRRNECPRLFADVAAGEAFVAGNADKDPRSFDLSMTYLRAVDSRTLVSRPIRAGGTVVGALWIEDAPAGAEDVEQSTFLAAVTNILSVRFAQVQAADPRAVTLRDALPLGRSEGGSSEAASAERALAAPLDLADVAAMRSSSIVRQRSERFKTLLAGRGREHGSVVATVFPHTSVLVLRLTNHLALAACPDDDSRLAIIDQLVRAFQRIAEERGIDFLKILSDQIVAVHGFHGDSRDDIVALAEAALAIRDECMRLFAAVECPPDFGIGIDTGTVIGSAVGFGQTAYNVWGEAVRVAARMAQSAGNGSIQLTQSTYDALSDRFIFRARGAFYLERVGEVRTFVLRGRA
jgi:hypothetical protein